MRFNHELGFIEIDEEETFNREGRPVYTYTIAPNDVAPLTLRDLRGGCDDDHDTAAGMRALADFVGAYVESLEYSERTGRETENGDLFPSEYADFLCAVSDELYFTCYED